MGRGSRSMHGGYKGAGASGASSSYRGGRAPNKPPLTHFLCLPLVNEETRPQLQASLDQFRKVIDAENESLEEASVIPPAAVRPLGTIHFTLGVMSLTSVDRLSEAIALLQTLDIGALRDEVLAERQDASDEDQSRELRISLTSLHSMHPARRTSILYAGPADPRKWLGPFCIKLRETFTKAGFLVLDDRPLKLHATILNTVYVKAGGRGISKATAPATEQQPDQSKEALPSSRQPISPPSSSLTADEPPPGTSHGHGPNAKAPIRLDATDLLEKCKDFVWAKDFTIGKIAICKMGAKKILDETGNVVDEQYEEVASVSLPA